MRRASLGPDFIGFAEMIGRGCSMSGKESYTMGYLRICRSCGMQIILRESSVRGRVASNARGCRMTHGSLTSGSS